MKQEEASPPEPAIIVDNISKSFRLPHERHSSLKQSALSFRGRKSYETQQVLKDISFTINHGDFFGIVGRNGSGKSTLLKLLAGIYVPDKGGVHVRGSLAPFIELGVGFNPELTGRDNVYLNGTLLGFNHKQIDKMYNEIVEFAELEKFMDQKLKNYSSGMQVRLAFSIAIRARSDILLIDEVLAVGDANFQRKCFEYFHQLKRDKQTVVFVTHDMDAVNRYCNKAILLNEGDIAESGDVETVIIKYNQLNMLSLDRQRSQQAESKVQRDGTGDAIMTKIETYKKGEVTTAFAPNDEIEIRIDVEVKNPLDNPVIGLNFRNPADVFVFGTNTYVEKIDLTHLKPGDSISLSCKFENIYHDDSYRITASIYDNNTHTVYDRIFNGHTFSTSGWRKTGSLVNPKLSFHLKRR